MKSQLKKEKSSLAKKSPITASLAFWVSPQGKEHLNIYFKMRVVLHVGKLIVIILVVWLLALIFLTGSLHRNNDSEEALAKKLIDAQSETLSYKRELGITQKL